MINQPLVSIVINNYNYAQFLPKAIESALQQTYQNIEIVIVDDGSTDNSVALIETYVKASQTRSGHRIVPVLKANGGHASTFNAGFAASKGEIVCFLDADDIFLCDKVERVVNALEEHPLADWCVHALQLFCTQTQNILGVTRAFPQQTIDASGPYDFRASIKQGYLKFYPPSTSGLCFRRELLSKILPMPEILQMAADRYLVQAALILSEGYFLQTPLTRQAIHSNNDGTMKTSLSSKKKKGQNEVLVAYFLHSRFPHAWKFSHRTFARGWGAIRKYGLTSKSIASLIQRYLASVSWIERIVIWMVSLYQNRPWKYVNLYRQEPVGNKPTVNKKRKTASAQPAIKPVVGQMYK
ncbi:MAG: glycosyltransferase [Cyanobacteria bacterium J06650_10]